MKAHILIRQQPHYRSEAFAAGLTKLGYSCRFCPTLTEPEIGDGDVVVVWNLHGRGRIAKRAADARGVPTLVAENGYVGKDSNGWQFYALALGGHCGSGWWPVGGPDRWARLGKTIQPWRETGNHILVCGQRGLGSETMASPRDFHDVTAKELSRHTKRPIRVRPHPGRQAPVRTLEEDLEGAWAVVVWSSNVASRALLAGIPAMYAAPHIITQGAATKYDPAKIDDPPMPGIRQQVFEKLAWAQWSCAELETGEPFRLLLKGAGR